MDTGKTYYDTEGKECSIWQMVKREPTWAAVRIQEGEKALDEIARLRAEVEALRVDAERWRFIRRKLCLNGNGDGTCSMHAINLPVACKGWPEVGQVMEFCDTAIDAARGGK